MLRLLSDENFNGGDIVRGLLLRQPDLDLVRVQDIGLAVQTTPTSWHGPQRTTESCCRTIARPCRTMHMSVWPPARQWPVSSS